MQHVPANLSQVISPADVTPFPEGSRVLHIGPPKTGTTALQTACVEVIDELLGQGLHYAGTRIYGGSPARAVTGMATIAAQKREVPSIKWWKMLLAEFDRSTAPRILYSSEALAEADDEAIARIVADVGPATHILVTLRPIDAVLASNWQQGIQHGSELSLEDWLHRIMNEDGKAWNGGFGRVLRQGELVDRWAAVAGRHRVTVVVLDPGDPGYLFRSMEALFALRPGTLHAYEASANRSLTMPEAETIRKMNIQAREAGLDHGTRISLIYGGAAANAKRKPAAEGAPRIRIPGWAVPWATATGEATVARLAASGVRVLGDPACLLSRTPGRPEAAGDEDLRIDPETAARLAMGIAWGFGLRLGPEQPGGAPRLGLPFVPTRMLVRQILRRARSTVRRQLRLAGVRGD